MQQSAPRQAPSSPLAMFLSRGWLLPMSTVAVLLLASYLPGHRVRDAFDLVASATAALGLIAISIALPRTIRLAILAGSRRPAFAQPETANLDGPERGALRRLGALSAALAVTTLVAWASAQLAVALPVERSAHAVTMLVFAANLWLILAYLVTAPPFSGWSVLLAIIDLTRTPPHRRLARAARIGQLGVQLLSALLVAAALASGHVMLVPVALALIVWSLSALRVAAADDAVARFLERRLVGDLLRPATLQFAAGEPLVAAAEAIDRGGIALVFATEGLVGAIGARQISAPALAMA